MAIVSVKQVGAGRSASGGSDYNRSYTVVWMIIVSDPNDGPATVGNAAGLPLRFVPYVGFENTSDPEALCTDLDVEQDGEEWQKWKATATFETRFTQEQDQHEDPEDRPAEMWVEFEDKTVKTTKTYNDLDIKNSAGQLIAGLEKDETVGVIVIERYESEFQPDVWFEFNNSTNSGTFLGCADQTLKMKITAAKAETINGFRVWPVTYKLKYKKDKWTVNPADTGTAVRGTDNKLHLAIDKATQQPKDGVIYLDGNGAEIEDPLNTPIEYIGDKALQEPRDWSTLNLV